MICGAPALDMRSGRSLYTERPLRSRFPGRNSLLPRHKHPVWYGVSPCSPATVVRKEADEVTDPTPFSRICNAAANGKCIFNARVELTGAGVHYKCTCQHHSSALQMPMNGGSKTQKKGFPTLGAGKPSNRLLARSLLRAD